MYKDIKSKLIKAKLIELPRAKDGRRRFAYVGYAQDGRRIVDPDFSVAASADDIYVYWDGAAWVRSLTNSHQYAGYVNSSYDKNGGGMRFLAVNVPAGATITAATITGISTVNNAQTTVNSVITGELDANAATFSDIANYQGRRGTIVGGADDTHITTANVAWDNIGAWTTGDPFTTPDFKAIIQEMVDTLGALTDIVIFWDDHAGTSTVVNNTYRRWASWDNTTYDPPKLTLTWTEAAVGFSRGHIIG